MSVWVRGQALVRLAAAAHTHPDTARAVLEALEAQGYVVAVRRELEEVARAAQGALRLALQEEPGSRDLRPLGECKGCGRDRRHPSRCCPDCSCHEALAIANGTILRPRDGTG